LYFKIKVNDKIKVFARDEKWDEQLEGSNYIASDVFV